MHLWAPVHVRGMYIWAPVTCERDVPLGPSTCDGVYLWAPVLVRGCTSGPSTCERDDWTNEYMLQTDTDFLVISGQEPCSKSPVVQPINKLINNNYHRQP